MLDNQMKHLNNNALCAIWIETTGDDPRKCDVVEICCYLLDNYIDLSTAIVPFYNQIMPYRPENIDYKTATISKEKIRDCTINGMEPTLAADRFEEWVTSLDLPNGKGIIPVTYNWPLMREYLVTWLGLRNFNGLFSVQYRDIVSVVYYLNDYDNQLAKPIRIPRPDSLAYICSLFGVQFTVNDDVMEKCVKMGKIYKLLLSANRQESELTFPKLVETTDTAKPIKVVKTVEEIKAIEADKAAKAIKAAEAAYDKS